MKNLSKIVLTLCAALSTVALGQEAMAARVTGRVTYVGTLQEDATSGYSARMRVRVEDSTCTTDTAPKTRWIHITSGRMDGQYAHNATNMRNAYNTLLLAFLTSANAEIDGVASCSATTPLTMNLWGSTIGIF